MEDEYHNLIEFDDESEAFARGFEAGRIWGILSKLAPEKGLKAIMRKDNAEMVLRIAEYHGRKVVSAGLEFTEEDIVEDEYDEEFVSAHMSVIFDPKVEYECV